MQIATVLIAMVVVAGAAICDTETGAARGFCQAYCVNIDCPHNHQANERACDRLQLLRGGPFPCEDGTPTAAPAPTASTAPTAPTTPGPLNVDLQKGFGCSGSIMYTMQSTTTQACQEFCASNGQSGDCCVRFTDRSCRVIRDTESVTCSPVVGNGQAACF
jgi:hypothetical protein